MAQLELTGIEKSFGTMRALSGVDLDVAQGEFVCLLGESGCGKTTLLRIVAGLETATSGALSINDEDVSGVPSHQRNIGMVFQALALFPHLNVGRNVAYSLELRGLSKEEQSLRVAALLDMVGLSGLESRSVAALSGGQRQRVAIARALATDPGLFLMDEPFSALDAGLREHMQVELKKLQRQLNITTLFVTHDQREAMTLADRIVVLNQGQIDQAGSPDEVYSRPATRFVANFLGTNNVLDVDFSATAMMFGDINLGAPPATYAALTGSQAVALRPEHLSIQPAPEGTEGLVGTVTFVRALGAVAEIEVQVGEHSFTQTDMSSRTVLPEVGDLVQLGFDASDLWVIPA